MTPAFRMPALDRISRADLRALERILHERALAYPEMAPALVRILLSRPPAPRVDAAWAGWFEFCEGFPAATVKSYRDLLDDRSAR